MPAETLNIAGGEWAVIVLVALFLLLGTDRLPDAARRLGRAAGEFERARGELREQAGGARGSVGAAGPVGSERAKLVAMADSLGIRHEGRSDEELRAEIRGSIGG